MKLRRPPRRDPRSATERVNSLLQHALTSRRIDREFLADAEVSRQTLEPLDSDHVLFWTLQVGGRKTTFAAQGPRLCHPVVMASLIEENLDGGSGPVVVTVQMVRRRVVRSFRWPASDLWEVLDLVSSKPLPAELSSRSVHSGVRLPKPRAVVGAISKRLPRRSR